MKYESQSVWKSNILDISSNILEMTGPERGDLELSQIHASPHSGETWIRRNPAGHHSACPSGTMPERYKALSTRFWAPLGRSKTSYAECSVQARLHGGKR